MVLGAGHADEASLPPGHQHVPVLLSAGAAEIPFTQDPLHILQHRWVR